uniref:Uncharacterized protein n=1 Tax=Arundo donax TaxID=35708 RepID=A0A0A9GDW4_ARUDO
MNEQKLLLSVVYAICLMLQQ